MKIGLISDTHDNSPAVTWIIEYLNQNSIPVAFHAGDIINPTIITRFRDHYQGHLHFVLGNNDGEVMMLTQIADQAKNLTCHNKEMSLEVEGKRLFMNHYSTFAEAQAKTQEYDICIGGHDHQFRVIPHGKSLFINPGNTVTHDKWMRSEDLNSQASFVILDLETMKPEQIIATLPNASQS